MVEAVASVLSDAVSPESTANDTARPQAGRLTDDLAPQMRPTAALKTEK